MVTIFHNWMIVLIAMLTAEPTYAQGLTRMNFEVAAGQMDAINEVVKQGGTATFPDLRQPIPTLDAAAC